MTQPVTYHSDGIITVQQYENGKPFQVLTFTSLDAMIEDVRKSKMARFDVIVEARIADKTEPAPHFPPTFILTIEQRRALLNALEPGSRYTQINDGQHTIVILDHKDHVAVRFGVEPFPVNAADGWPALLSDRLATITDRMMKSELAVLAPSTVSTWVHDIRLIEQALKALRK